MISLELIYLACQHDGECGFLTEAQIHSIIIIAYHNKGANNDHIHVNKMKAQSIIIRAKKGF